MTATEGPFDARRPAFVVADVHGNLDALAGLLRQARILNDEWERVDRETLVVQMGDLCNCVARSMSDDNRCLDHVEKWLDVYLVGNHEHPYFGGPAFGGYWRDPVIAHRLGLLNSLGIIQPCIALGEDILVSHAGVADGWDEIDSPYRFAREAQRLWKQDPRHDLFSAIGRSRGGWGKTGGILWSDWDEPKSHAFSQVVGHTVGDSIRWQREDDWFAVCLDLGAKDRGSRLAGAWIRGNEVEPVIFDPAEEIAA